jgi:molybdopterin converting factor small subunit
MNIKIRLMPPYRKKNDPGEHLLNLRKEITNLEELARYLSAEQRDLFGYALIDARGVLTAEFMVNGKNAALETILNEGDLVTVIPYICGG